MDPKSLITPQLFKSKITIICGPARSGKSTIAKELSSLTGKKLFNTDDYREQFGEDRVVDRLFSMFLREHYSNRSAIFSGVHCARLVRLIATRTNIALNIIKIDCDEDTIRYFYNESGDSSKLRHIIPFNKSLETIWSQFKKLSRGRVKHNITYFDTSLK